MIIKQMAIKCDKCKTSEITSIIKCFKSYGATCKKCGHTPLIDGKDVVILSMLVLFSYIFSPIQWLIIKITGKKPDIIKIGSENGETYKVIK